MSMSPTAAKPAFKYDFGPGSLKRIEPVGMPKDINFARIVLLATVLLHLLVLMLNPSWFMSPPVMDMEQSISVDVDFMSFPTLTAPQETALPNSKKSEEAAVPANLLPQLPKKFEIEEVKNAEEKPFVEEKDRKADDSIAKKQVANPEETVVPKTKEDQNKVTKDDLMKRLAVEKLKQENKVDQQMKAQKDALAKLKEELIAKNAAANTGAGASGVGAIRKRTYIDLLSASVKRNFYLPKTFEYDRSKLVTLLSVVINSKGDLVDVKVSASSGNGAYDQAVVSAFKNSVPLPQPPADIAGQVVTFQFHN
jgi:TonB family protein